MGRSHSKEVVREVVHVQPQIVEKIGNTKNKIGVMQESIEQDKRRFDESLKEQQSHTDSVLETLAKEGQLVTANTAAGIAEAEARAQREEELLDVRIKQLTRMSEEQAQKIMDAKRQKDQADRMIAVKKKQLEDRKNLLDVQREKLVQDRDTLLESIEEARNKSARCLKDYLDGSAVCDTSMAGLIDLLGHLNSLPYKTNETNAHGIHDYLVGVCKVMRENVDRATAALAENTNMDRDASIAWARKRVGNKIAQWMEEEELEVSTLITFMKTEDLRQSMPTMSSLQYHQFIKNLEKLTNNEEGIITNAQKGMGKVAQSLLPMRTWDDPMRAIEATVSTSSNPKLINM